VRRLAAICLAFVLAWPLAAEAAADRPLDDPALEARALHLHQEIRCLVCQGQSIGDSNSDLASDLRRLVRERLVAGDSDQAVLDYLHSRYGDFVLLDPPVNPATYVLWFGPPLLLVIGAITVFLYHRRNRRPAATAPKPLSASEQQAFNALMGGDKPSS
jgi:cytochrome c-type biogenesis protein CcmH